jgi:hypothetical protein
VYNPSPGSAVPYLLITSGVTEVLQLLPLIWLLISALCLSTTAGCCAAVCLLELLSMLLLPSTQVAAAGRRPAAGLHLGATYSPVKTFGNRWAPRLPAVRHLCRFDTVLH